MPKDLVVNRLTQLYLEPANKRVCVNTTYKLTIHHPDAKYQYQ